MSFDLTLNEGFFLTNLAREAIKTYLETGKKIAVPSNTPNQFKEKAGLFVTLNKLVEGKKELRGCIGFPFPYLPIVDATIEAAISAAIHDPRFSPIEGQDLMGIVLEVSILSPPKLIEIDDPRDYVKKVRVGKDGLIVENGGYTGLLLPQVPIEWHWDAETFLSNCCMKAGLPPDMWLVKRTKVYVFSTIITQELLPGGPIEIIDMRR